MDHIIDWEYEDLIELMEQDPTKISIFIMELYKCTEAEAVEAITYIKSFIEDYDPIDGIEYNKELTTMLTKFKDEHNE
jgi:hypothetical protein